LGNLKEEQVYRRIILKYMGKKHVYVCAGFLAQDGRITKLFYVIKKQELS
jgi:hypothetical protein